MADLADHAYAHACAILGPGEAAMGTALIAVRRGGRSRAAVLGHARHEGLLRALQAPPADLDVEAPADLSDLAFALVAARPARERALVDLETRHDLDRSGLARASGISASAVAARLAAIGGEWQHQLDPVVLARLGPGDCDALAAVLDAERDLDASPTIRALLAAGALVSDHAAGCEVCRDRLRSAVSVRTLVAQRALEDAPSPVRDAAAPARLRRPSPPPPLEPEAPSRRWLKATVAAAVAVVFAAGVAAAISATRRPSTDTRVEALTRVPAAGSALVASPAGIEGLAPPPVELRNDSRRSVRWQATPDATWIHVVPAAGVLGPRETARLRVTLTRDAPEGEARGTIRLTGADGSTTVIRVTAIVEHAPDLAAAAAGCSITATVEDESGIGSVELHSATKPARTGAPTPETILSMGATETGYAATLPRSTGPAQWWVTAVDARGNVARTPDATITPDSCP